MEGQPSTAASVLLRGVVAIFRVNNKGKKDHNFAVFGKETPVLKPGAKAYFQVILLSRGKFRYESTLRQR